VLLVLRPRPGLSPAARAAGSSRMGRRWSCTTCWALVHLPLCTLAPGGARTWP
jgi:hypothetical protein